MGRRQHRIEVTWNDEQLGPDAARALFDGELMTGGSVGMVLRRIQERLTEEKPPSPPNNLQPARYRCSFCGRGEGQVQVIVAGPNGLHACDECVGLLQAALTEYLESI